MTVTSDSDFFSARPVAGESADSYDALAELFLGQSRPANPNLRISSPSEDDSNHRDAALVRPAVETLVLGHLPVMAGPWAMTYAANAAASCAERVAMIRLTDGRVSVDMMNDDGEWSGSVRNVDEALRLAVMRSHRLMIRTDVVNEPITTLWPEADEVTVLTSADEAAVVDAYTILKKLASEFDPTDADDAYTDAEGPLLKVAVVGADESRARRAFEKLCRAANAFLSYPICEAGVIERIETTRARNVYRSEHPMDIETLLDKIHDALEHDPADDQFAPAPVEYETVASPSEPIAFVEAASVEPDREPESPTTTTTATSRPVSFEGRLARHIDGLTPLESRCPYDDTIELAIDEEGRLHLLARADAMAMESLAIVEEWADAHAALLQAASAGEASFDPSLSIQRHLFSDDPPSVRRLLDTPMHVHLLTHVELEHDAGWLCRDLN